MSTRYGYLLLVIVWLSWGPSYPFTAIVLRSMDVWTSRCLITTAAGILMLALVRAGGRSIAVPRAAWRDLGVAALFNIAVFQIGMTYGVSLLSPGRTSVIVYTMPVWASLFAVGMLGERLTPPRVLALGLGLAALAVLMSQDLSKLGNAPLGAALTLMAAISFGFGTVWMKRRRWQTDPTVLGGWQLLLGAIPIWLIWALLRPDFRWEPLDFEGWFAVLYLALVSNALAYFAWFRVIAIFPAMISGIGTLGVPIVGVLSSAVLVGEAIGWRELTALLLVCSALSLVLLVGAPASRPAATQGD